MTLESDQARRQQLGAFLRSQRARLSPALFGLPGGARRRTPGLRREEVAQLGGLSTTWYTWLEQGRDISLSAHALGRLAGVLKFSPAERSYLFDLAGKRDPQGAGDAEPAAPAALLAALETVAAPAYVIDPLWNALGWNKAAADLFTGWLDGDNDRNLLHFIFLKPEARLLIEDWDARARRVIAEFRIDYGHHLDEPAMQALVARLVRESPFFAEAWHGHSVTGREGGLRRFNHPRRGRLDYQQVTLNPTTRPDLKFVILVGGR
ncbi:helix-turn-helix transcriptional regulator [Labrys monachus]|uniref:Transcriptional regulator with XRE-family HTH domain n=1 Tax=Labrys monachus TaxID=217067 RepID=A0ABU0FMU7_9HYPH|nr:helix-turn-helix transcriptional regulator [Labrys monachus]MDQ0395933.1 transcriptional regulator with XRE-family HTH domain [Labrys monachus]